MRGLIGEERRVAELRFPSQRLATALADPVRIQHQQRSRGYVDHVQDWDDLRHYSERQIRLRELQK